MFSAPPPKKKKNRNRVLKIEKEIERDKLNQMNHKNKNVQGQCNHKLSDEHIFKPGAYHE